MYGITLFFTILYFQTAPEAEFLLIQLSCGAHYFICLKQTTTRLRVLENGRATHQRSRSIKYELMTKYNQGLDRNSLESGKEMMLHDIKGLCFEVEQSEENEH